MLTLFQIDAFTDQLFGGNPAAVVPLNGWIDDGIMQAIAMENNLAETAFIVPVDGDEPNRRGFELRWFTPVSEVALCGHATLATAHAVFNHLGYEKDSIDFFTRESGTLTVTKRDDGKLSMSFPSIPLTKSDDIEIVSQALGIEPSALFAGFYSADQFDYVAILESVSQVTQVAPRTSEFEALNSRGVIVTAAGEQCDFVSRYFAPLFGVDEDPVTGSAHCLLAPYWAKALGKTDLTARQISHRGGLLGCEIVGGRTLLTGRCVDYLKGQINVPSA